MVALELDKRRSLSRPHRCPHHRHNAKVAFNSVPTAMLSCRHLIGRLLSAQCRQATTTTSAKLLDQQFVEIEQPDGQRLKYPNVWLRDNCQCEKCFHAPTRARQSHWERGPLNVQAKSVAYEEQQQQLVVHWQDAHKSSYDLQWLRERDFGAETRSRYLKEVYKPPAQLWGKLQFEQVTREFLYEDVMANDEVLLAWLEALAVQGFALLRQAPADVEVVRRLAERIGYIKRTTYGDVFEVKSKPNAGNYAYLMTPLPMHTDMPYYEYKAGINILHTLVQSSSPGGANTLTDGFYIAAKLRDQYPKYYELLSSVPVNWYDIGRDGDMTFHSLWRAPIICLDVDGQFARINQNTTKRDSRFTVPLEQVVPWYEAYDKFLQLIQDEAVEFKTQSGDIFVFNNLRMLHGRTAYEDSPQNKRHLVGAYVDWDIIYSKLRTLKFGQVKG
ncbi:gamma-butyrobetaine dioxygenase [Scaptodrosophila lebanonensis]|uniref:Gamma-butyrobetaine dioxygenase n=1 Tax=Drosophila lebanonensis TaxID=7225 RepID=A0A6J2TW48_DROLE|nr:gamma-butyrobetaine dioxygenase [Scaptodrosophila lebanonensis]